MTALPILYRDEHYVAVDKPTAMLMHRSGISRDRVFVMQTVRDQLRRWVYLVHRLDRATSGVLLFALSPEAARRMCERFADGAVRKRYLAVARGFAPAEAVVDRPVREEKESEPRPALTRFRTLGTVELDIPVQPYPSARYSLVEAYPETGRRHQIRKHLRDINHPIVGDVNYGDRHHNHMFQERFGLNRLLLMARALGFEHPFSGERLTIEAPLPPPVADLFARFGWSGLDTPNGDVPCYPSQ